MNILTFGSCLARTTAVCYARLYGGEIVSSTYHNRSDAFIGRFVEKNWIDYPKEQVGKFLNEDDGTVTTEFTASVILNNQYPDQIGLHGIAEGQPLFEILQQHDVDLIIVDNHIDLGARLSSKQGEPNAGVFLRYTDIIEDRENTYWKTGDLLPVEQAVISMKKVIDYLRAQLPTAKVVFINFPYNVYEGSEQRIERTKLYEQHFNYENVLIIPCVDVPKAYQTSDRQHFTSHEYSFYAGIINDYVRSSI